MMDQKQIDESFSITKKVYVLQKLSFLNDPFYQSKIGKTDEIFVYDLLVTDFKNKLKYHLHPKFNNRLEIRSGSVIEIIKFEKLIYANSQFRMITELRVVDQQMPIDSTVLDNLPVCDGSTIRETLQYLPLVGGRGCYFNRELREPYGVEWVKEEQIKYSELNKGIYETSRFETIPSLITKYQTVHKQPKIGILGKVIEKSNLIHYGSINKNKSYPFQFTFTICDAFNKNFQISITIWDKLIIAFFYSIKINHYLLIRNYRIKKHYREQTLEICIDSSKINLKKPPYEIIMIVPEEVINKTLLPKLELNQNVFEKKKIQNLKEKIFIKSNDDYNNNNNSESNINNNMTIQNNDRINGDGGINSSINNLNNTNTFNTNNNNNNFISINSSSNINNNGNDNIIIDNNTGGGGSNSNNSNTNTTNNNNNNNNVNNTNTFNNNSNNNNNNINNNKNNNNNNKNNNNNNNNEMEIEYESDNMYNANYNSKGNNNRNEIYEKTDIESTNNENTSQNENQKNKNSLQRIHQNKNGELIGVFNKNAKTKKQKNVNPIKNDLIVSTSRELINLTESEQIINYCGIVCHSGNSNFLKNNLQFLVNIKKKIIVLKDYSADLFIPIYFDLLETATGNIKKIQKIKNGSIILFQNVIFKKINFNNGKNLILLLACPQTQIIDKYQIHEQKYYQNLKLYKNKSNFNSNHQQQMAFEEQMYFWNNKKPYLQKLISISNFKDLYKLDFIDCNSIPNQEKSNLFLIQGKIEKIILKKKNKLLIQVKSSYDDKSIVKLHFSRDQIKINIIDNFCNSIFFNDFFLKKQLKQILQLKKIAVQQDRLSTLLTNLPLVFCFTTCMDLDEGLIYQLIRMFQDEYYVYLPKKF
ncbi:rpa-related protein radx [Anaeramoeba flamelloides]|uniref:Rpa-related protein radx n=1 Tax=Anaeramoeba flamelloides TaxID=1746091 RepID=A0ABQ8YXS4_9EUKA|nr:rpa-related protein radx [Anaeramoeba flamelloides]